MTADARSKRLTLVAVIMGSFVVGVDTTVVNVALPTLARDLGGGLAGQQWVVNAYLLALGSFMLLGGSLGDLFGERRVFAIGVAGFGIGSLACAASPSIEVLVAARVIQGLAGALLTPAALAVIIATFKSDERGAAIGTWTAWSGVATVVGPLAGGQLLDIVSWRWIFAINIPFVALTLALVPRIPQRTERASSTKVDWVGAGLAALGLAGPVFALVEQPRYGWGDSRVLGPGIAGIALLAIFVRWERRSRAPMLPLSLFRTRNFTAGNVETFALYGGLGAFFFFLGLFLQQVAGFTPLESGLTTLPPTLIMFALSRRFGRLADRVGARILMGLGPLVSASGLLLLRGLDTDVDWVTELLPGLTVFSLGLSMTVTPLTTAVLAGADDSDAGIASAVNNTVARVAGLMATAAIGAVVAAQFSSSLAERLPDRLSPRATASAAAAERESLGIPVTTGLQAAEARAVGAAGVDASLDAFRSGLLIVTVLVGAGGVLGLVAVRSRTRVGSAAEQPLPSLHGHHLAVHVRRAGVRPSGEI